MNSVKKLFTAITGYWLHKLDTLPIGTDLFFDIHNRIQYQNIDVVFDVGANNGQTLRWVRLNEPKTKIFCFEPVKDTFLHLQKNAGQDTNSVLENIAFGETSGEKVIKVFDDFSVLNSLKNELMNNTENARSELIQIETIDLYCERKSITKIDLLKIDTEGYEENVLQGAIQMLQSAAISFVYCETGFMKSNKRNTYFPELTEWMAEQDYYFFGLYNLDMHDWKRGNYFGNALYVHKDILANELISG